MAEVRLHNNVAMPILGLGTSHSGGYSHDAVMYALKSCEYRLIDTARRYGNEENLQKAIEESGVPRENLFLATKLWPTDYGFQSTIDAFRLSRKRLGCEYLDLYLLHWPTCPSWIANPRSHLEETWRALEQLYDCERVRAIGVSNYLEDDLERLLETASIVPHVNQFEYHPYLDGAETLRAYCLENKIQPMGSCPLAKGEILSRPEVMNIARKLGKTPAQICIRYSIQSNVVTIPKSLRLRRLRENSAIYNWSIPEEDMTLLRDAPPPEARCVNRNAIQRKIDDLTTADGYKLVLSSDTPTQAGHCERELYVQCR